MFGRYVGVPSRAELDRAFFLDDADLALVARRRGDHMRLGFGLQLVTVRFLGTFLADPLDVPQVVVDYLAEQLSVADASCVKRYGERAKTRLEHAWEIQEALGLTEFAGARDELTGWIEARAWTTGDGPSAIFADSVDWLRSHRVLLPGVSVLARLVARVREATTMRLWETLAGTLTTAEKAALDELLVVGDGDRVCVLERWRKGPTVVSSPAMVRALERISEISERCPDSIDVVPPRRLVELARYGLTGKTTLLRRHPPARRHATLLASVHYLARKATDDALELLDELVANDLVGSAVRAAEANALDDHAKLIDAAALLAVAVRLLLEGVDRLEETSLREVWGSIEMVVRRDMLEHAVATVEDVLPGSGDPDDDWRALLSSRRIGSVSRFLRHLTGAIEFGADPEASLVLAAMKTIPALLERRGAVMTGDIDARVVNASWRRLVFAGGAGGAGVIDRNAYVFCVLTQFHRHLKRRGIYAPASTRWTDPRAALLTGANWAANKDRVLTALSLPIEPTALLAEHRDTLDGAYRRVIAGLDQAGSAAWVDGAGRVHVTSLDALAEPESLVELRAKVAAMLPRVDLPEVVLEVMSWEPGFVDAFTSRSGGEARLDGLDVSIAACLTAQAMNIGYRPIARRGVPALERDRLSHVAQTYFSSENLAAANAPLIRRQADIGFARLLGGGLVAAVDGMRFVVPVPSIYARPNRRYFGRDKGVTWLNMINDQAIGLGAKVVSGTVRDSLHIIDVLYSQDGGQRPDIVVTDTASYSDVVFGLLQLLGFSYLPALADLPDQKMWTIEPANTYGPLATAGRGRISLKRIAHHWTDITRVVASIHTGTVRAYDVVRMLQRDGHPTALGEATAAYGRIFKTLHMLAVLDDETYRRQIKGIRNLQEGRHALAQKIFHGKKGELYQRYHEGMEDQLGALGLVLNCVVLRNTYYIDLAVARLRADSHTVNDDDVARLSAYMRKQINVHGTYSFARADTAGQPRPLRDPTTIDHDDE